MTGFYMKFNTKLKWVKKNNEQFQLLTWSWLMFAGILGKAKEWSFVHNCF